MMHVSMLLSLMSTIRRCHLFTTPTCGGIAFIILTGVFHNPANALNMETVSVGNAGNTADTQVMWITDGTSGYGSVGYAYRMGKYEVTVGQYTEFLNKVARIDTYGLYNTDMARTDYGCGISRSGNGTASSPYSYSVGANFTNRPASFVNWGDAVRFANWMHNGQPSGAQDVTTTEDGSYYLNGATSITALQAVTRKSNATWAIPSENEWYKAAYYDPTKPGGAGYWDYATGTDSLPGWDMTEATNPGNNANYYSDPNPIYAPTNVGEFQLSDSPYGTFDQTGNMWEWNEALLHNDSTRGLRGGCFANYSIYQSSSYRYCEAPTYENGACGFRVVEVPEPCTAVILIAGSTILMRRRPLTRQRLAMDQPYPARQRVR